MPPDATADPAAYCLARQAGFLLRRASQRHLTIFARALPELTPRQFAALAELCALGEASQNALGRATAMDAATIKGVVDRLRARGLVAAQRDRDDGRRVRLAPTASGRALFAEVVPAAQAITRETLAPLSAAEQRQFLALLSRLC